MVLEKVFKTYNVFQLELTMIPKLTFSVVRSDVGGLSPVGTKTIAKLCEMQVLHEAWMDFLFPMQCVECANTVVEALCSLSRND